MLLYTGQACLPGMKGKSMNCPYCGAEMECGFLQAGASHGIYWLKHRTKYRPPQQAKGAEGLCEQDNLIQSPYIPASRCPKCKKVIFSY